MTWSAWCRIVHCSAANTTPWCCRATSTNNAAILSRSVAPLLLLPLKAALLLPSSAMSMSSSASGDVASIASMGLLYSLEALSRPAGVPAEAADAARRGSIRCSSVSMSMEGVTRLSANHTMPQRDTVARVACLKSDTSNNNRTLSGMGRRSPLGRVSSLDSSDGAGRGNKRGREKEVRRPW